MTPAELYKKQKVKAFITLKTAEVTNENFASALRRYIKIPSATPMALELLPWGVFPFIEPIGDYVVSPYWDALKAITSVECIWHEMPCGYRAMLANFYYYNGATDAARCWLFNDISEIHRPALCLDGLIRDKYMGSADTLDRWISIHTGRSLISAGQLPPIGRDQYRLLLLTMYAVKEKQLDIARSLLDHIDTAGFNLVYVWFIEKIAGYTPDRYDIDAYATHQLFVESNELVPRYNPISKREKCQNTPPLKKLDALANYRGIVRSSPSEHPWPIHIGSACAGCCDPRGAGLNVYYW